MSREDGVLVKSEDVLGGFLSTGDIDDVTCVVRDVTDVVRDVTGVRSECLNGCSGLSTVIFGRLEVRCRVNEGECVCVRE